MDERRKARAILSISYALHLHIHHRAPYTNNSPMYVRVSTARCFLRVSIQRRLLPFVSLGGYFTRRIHVQRVVVFTSRHSSVSLESLRGLLIKAMSALPDCVVNGVRVEELHLTFNPR